MLKYVSFVSLLSFHWALEKLIEGLKSPDTSSLMLPDLLSLSDPFGGNVEESAKGVCVCVYIQVSVFKNASNTWKGLKKKKKQLRRFRYYSVTLFIVFLSII